MKFAKQVGPLCGLYSLYNGLVYLKAIDKDSVDCNVLNVLQRFTNNPTMPGYTEIGEYFDIDNYLSFIQSCDVNNIKFNENYTAQKVNLYDGIYKINNDDKCFIIVPTNPKKTRKNKIPKQNQDVLDWITVYKTGLNLFIVLNPNTHPRFKARALNTKNGIINQNKYLRDKYFTWNQYKHTPPEKARDGKDRTGFKKAIRKTIHEKWNDKQNKLLNSNSKIDYDKNIGQCIIIKRKE